MGGGVYAGMRMKANTKTGKSATTGGKGREGTSGQESESIVASAAAYTSKAITSLRFILLSETGGRLAEWGGGPAAAGRRRL